MFYVVQMYIQEVLPISIATLKLDRSKHTNTAMFLLVKQKTTKTMNFDIICVATAHCQWKSGSHPAVLAVTHRKENSG